MDDQRTDRDSSDGGKNRPSKWWVAIPIAITAFAIRGPDQLNILFATIAWIVWAVVTFRKTPFSPLHNQADKEGCITCIFGGVVVMLGSFYAIGAAMSDDVRGAKHEGLIGIVILFGLIIVALGVFFIVTQGKK